MNLWLRIKRIGVALTPVAASIILAVQTYLGGDGKVDLAEGLAVLTLFFGGLLIYAVPQIPEAPWTKTVIGVFLALIALGSLFWESVVKGWPPSTQETWMIVVAVATALGVIPAPATSDNGTRSGIGAPSLSELHRAGVR